MSKLAQAGDSSTASPGCAICAARCDRFLHGGGAFSGTPLAAIAFSISAASRPISSTCFACSRIAGRERREILALAVAAEDQHRLASPRPFSAATVAPTLVPLESSSHSTPPRTATRCMRCGRPRKLRRPWRARRAARPRRRRARRPPARWRRCARPRAAGRRRRGCAPCRAPGIPSGEAEVVAASSGASRPKVSCVRPGSASAIEAESQRLSTCTPAPLEDARLGLRVVPQVPRSGRGGPR